MRISSSPDDPSYSQHFHKCRIFVAGSERNNVITADEGKRYALLLRRDEFGAPALNKHGEQIKEPYFGDVRIECDSWLRVAQEHDSQTEDALTIAVFGMVQTP